jgi:phosphocarrier protein FPr
MVGIVLVSHSRPLAEAVKQLVRALTGPELPLAIAAGAGDDHVDLGTDAVEILEAIQSVMSDEGVLVLMDMGSAVLSAETAFDFLEEAQRAKVQICPAPLVEGAVAAAVTANLGSSLAEVAREAQDALKQKTQHLPEAGAAASNQAPAADAEVASITFLIKNPHGLHARPAARFIKEGARFAAEIQVENLTTQRGPVSAKSLSALASLEILSGQEVRVRASGAQAQEALHALRELAEANFGEATAGPSTPKLQVFANGRKPQAIPVGDGLAIGSAYFLQRATYAVSADLIDDAESETKRLRAAVASARAALLNEARKIKNRADAATAEIFEAQALVLDDPDLLERALTSIRSQKWNAARAWEQSVQTLEAQYRQLQDEYLRQRAADVQDVGRRVLGELGLEMKTEVVPPHSILIADDLLPAEVSQLDPAQVAGVILLEGGRTSHSAILLRMLGIPTIAQARPFFAEGPPPAVLAFDGATGELWLNPSDEKMTELRREQAAFQAERAREIKFAQQPAVTAEGHRVEIFANVTTATEALAALKAGGEGIGLLRTEFLFLERTSAPDEAEQFAALRPVIEAMDGRPVVVRTLDAGGDKELGYLGLPREANPFLGLRALRICLRQPELFHPQLRSILRAGSKHDVRILFPMVTELAELLSAQTAVQAAHDELRREGISHAWPVKTGAMIEVPSAALMADALAESCDFFSIGTNDLTQYTLAADRGNAQLGAFQDALHPAVLLLIERVIAAAHGRRKPVAICGEAASDPLAALVFTGLGVDELSMSPTAIPKIKAALREAKFGDLQQLARMALKLHSAEEVRAAVAAQCAEMKRAQASAA